MKISKYILFAILLLTNLAARATDGKYIYKLDLTHVVDDKVYIELTIEGIIDDQLIFNLPRMIPGTYAIEDYGRFVSKFKAVDKRGKKLPVKKTSTNSWQISKAKKLVKISYWIEDSFDTELTGPEIFDAAGTNIEDGKNFVLNSSGFFGYFDGMTNLEYEINIVRPDGFYGSTGLIPLSVNDNLSTNLGMEVKNFDSSSKVDVFSTGNYDELVDSPIMYCLPDTTVIGVAGTEVLISVYSPNVVINSKEIANTVEEVLMAQRDYLGGQLPVDKYAFLFYFTDEPILEYGALEHSYSSFYYMPEYKIEDNEQQLRDFAAHEFFHIVTPLSIHSEEIKPFDFSNPKMSKHLWLYEGMTEYFAGNAQVKGGIVSLDQYVNTLREKMYVSVNYYNDTLAMTELSLGALDTYEDQYMNVYQKGALIGMALDITLLGLSDGKYGVQQMMAYLSKEYGIDKAFKDDELFDKITELTYPEIRDFFSAYVEGSTPLPLREIFNMAGVIFEEEGIFYDYSIGVTDANLAVDMERNELYIQNEEKLDDFGKLLGLKDKDILHAINGVPFPELGPLTMPFLEEVVLSMEEGKDFSITVLRANEEGEEEEVVLTAKTLKIARTVPYAIRPMNEPTEKQLRVRAAWLGLKF